MTSPGASYGPTTRSPGASIPTTRCRIPTSRPERSRPMRARRVRGSPVARRVRAFAKAGSPMAPGVPGARRWRRHVPGPRRCRRRGRRSHQGLRPARRRHLRPSGSRAPPSGRPRQSAPPCSARDRRRRPGPWPVRASDCVRNEQGKESRRKRDAPPFPERDLRRAFGRSQGLHRGGRRSQASPPDRMRRFRTCSGLTNVDTRRGIPDPPCSAPAGRRRLCRAAAANVASKKKRGRTSPDVRPHCFPRMRSASPVPISGHAPLGVSHPGCTGCVRRLRANLRACPSRPQRTMRA